MAVLLPLFAMHPLAPDARVARIFQAQIQVRSALLHGDLALLPKAPRIVLFEEPGTRQPVAGPTSEWLERQLARHANARIRQQERDSHVVC